MLTPNPTSGSGGFAGGLYDNGCYNLAGYQGLIQRFMCANNGLNMISYTMNLNDPYNGTCTSLNSSGTAFENANYANHPVVQLALAINKITGTVPAAATIAASGLPYAPSGGSPTTCTGTGGAAVGYVTASGNYAVNYCYLFATSGANVKKIVCPFTN